MVTQIASWTQDNVETAVEVHGNKLHLIESQVDPADGRRYGQQLQAVMELEDALTLAHALQEFLEMTAPQG